VTCRTRRRGGRVSRYVSLRKGNLAARWRHNARSWVHTARYHVFTHLYKTLLARRCVRWVDRLRQEASRLLLCVDNLGSFGFTSSSPLSRACPSTTWMYQEYDALSLVVLGIASTTLMYQEYDALSLVVLGIAMSTTRPIASRFV